MQMKHYVDELSLSKEVMCRRSKGCKSNFFKSCKNVLGEGVGGPVRSTNGQGQINEHLFYHLNKTRSQIHSY